VRLILAPFVTVATRARRALRGEDDARYAVLVGSVLLLAVAWAGFVTIADRSDSRGRGWAVAAQLLLGLREVPDERQWALWAARAVTVLLAASIAGLLFIGR